MSVSHLCISTLTLSSNVIVDDHTFKCFQNFKQDWEGEMYALKQHS